MVRFVRRFTGAMSRCWGRTLRAKSVDAVVGEIDIWCRTTATASIHRDDLFISDTPGLSNAPPRLARGTQERSRQLHGRYPAGLRCRSGLVQISAPGRACVGDASAWRLGPTSNCAPTWPDPHSWTRCADTINALQQLGIDVVGHHYVSPHRAARRATRNSPPAAKAAKYTVGFKFIGGSSRNAIYQAYSDADYLTAKWPRSVNSSTRGHPRVYADVM